MVDLLDRVGDADAVAVEGGAVDRHEVELDAEAAAADEQEGRLARAVVGVEVLGVPERLAVHVDHLALAPGVQVRKQTALGTSLGIRVRSAKPTVCETPRWMAAAAAISVRELVVDRGGDRVLDAITLDVPAGQITGLLGPSGCGKSTLMRAIVGVQIVASGDVTVLDLPAGSAALRSDVGYVTQAPSVYLDLTARENLRYFARVLDAAGDGWRRRLRRSRWSRVRPAGRHASQAASGPACRWPRRCSAEPRLLVLDEPTVGLDPVLRNELWARFRELTDGGTTLLVSSHVMDEADRCDGIVLMRDGRVLAAKPREQLLAETGADGVEEAFLRLVGGAVSAAGRLATARRVLRSCAATRARWRCCWSCPACWRRC